MAQEIQVADLKKEMYRYIDKAIFAQEPAFMAVSSYAKLSFLQLTPKNRIKTREIGNKTIPYMKIEYYERALNLVSNFKWGWHILYRWDIVETTEEKTYTDFKTKEKKKKTVKKYEAMLHCEFWIMLDWEKVTRPSIWAWTSYENPATTKFDVYKSAYANAVKNFAKSFGIGADVQEEQNEAISEERINDQKEVWKTNETDYKGKLILALEKKWLKTTEMQESYIKAKLWQEVDLETITATQAQDLIIFTLQ